jgi:hypothetical protein
MVRLYLFCFTFFIGLFSHLGAYELAIAAMFKNEAPYLKEWVEYHRLVGVDHFWLYNDTSSDNWEEVLQPYIQEGLVEVIDWSNKHAPDKSWIPAQIEAYVDAFRRAKLQVTWVAPIDIDEFLVPMKEQTVTECLQKHFSHAKAVYVNWRNFGTSGVTIPTSEPILFQLTDCSLKGHSDNSVGKSILRPACVLLSGQYYPHHFFLLNNDPYADGEGNPMYFQGTILPTDGRHKDCFLRINHYVLRDESCYKTKRLARATGADREMLLEHYKSFSLMRDFAITRLIRKHQVEFEKIWRPFIK